MFTDGLSDDRMLSRMVKTQRLRENRRNRIKIEKILECMNSKGGFGKFGKSQRPKDPRSLSRFFLGGGWGGGSLEVKRDALRAGAPGWWRQRSLAARRCPRTRTASRGNNRCRAMRCRRRTRC